MGAKGKDKTNLIYEDGRAGRQEMTGDFECVAILRRVDAKSPILMLSSGSKYQR